MILQHQECNDFYPQCYVGWKTHTHAHTHTNIHTPPLPPPLIIVINILKAVVIARDKFPPTCVFYLFGLLFMLGEKMEERCRQNGSPSADFAFLSLHFLSTVQHSLGMWNALLLTLTLMSANLSKQASAIFLE